MLVEANLVTALSPIFDPESTQFASFPATMEDACDFWAQAVGQWAGLVLPVTTTTAAATRAFHDVLLAQLRAGNVRALEAAFTALAIALAPGMAPAFAATPPPAVLDFTPVYQLGLASVADVPGQNRACLVLMVDIATAWLRTGLAVPATSGPAVSWS